MFLQGYYDASGIGADSFDKAIHISSSGRAELTEEMRNKHMYLTQTVEPSIFYLGFNMLDAKVGGLGEKSEKLRQALSIAVNYDEYIAIFYNGRGQAAQGPIPPGIYGYKDEQAGTNPYVYEWRNNHRQRRSLAKARTLLVEAGYPQGIDPKTHKALILHYDVSTSGGPEDKAYWIGCVSNLPALGFI